MKTVTRTLRAERGTTLVVVMILIIGFLALAVGGLVSATSDFKVSRNYTSGAQALLCAEAGLLHAQKVIDSYGPIRFNFDVTPNWATLWGTSAVTMTNNTSCRYTVTPTADPVSAAENLLLTSVGTGPDGAQRTVRSRLQLTNGFSPGAIYIPNPNVQGDFQGSRFLVDGNDTNYDGSGPGPSAAVPGMSTSTAAAAQRILDELNPEQEEGVIGLGGASSVFRAEGPTSDRIEDEIIPNLISQPGVVMNPLLNGNDTFGSIASPQITYFSSSISLAGNVTGAGVLVVDGAFVVTGDIEFVGLILVRGTTDISTVITGNATILGAIWTTEVELKVGGSASVTYSTQALDLAGGIGGGEILPSRVSAAAWSQL